MGHVDPRVLVDSVSIGWTVWKAMKKAEAARADAVRPGAEQSQDVSTSR